jgi:hypothetical protein
MDQEIRILNEFTSLTVGWHDWDTIGDEYVEIFERNPDDDPQDIVDQLRGDYITFLERLHREYPRAFKIVPNDYITHVYISEEIKLRDLLDILTRVARYLEAKVIPYGLDEDISFLNNNGGVGIIRREKDKKVIKVYYTDDGQFKKLKINIGKVRKMM